MNDITPETRQRILLDLLNARHDVEALATAHDVPLETLAAWVQEPATQRSLNGLRLLADVQAQLYASRTRPAAVSRLLEMMHNEKGEFKPDDVRRACIELLRADIAVALVSAGAADEGPEVPEPDQFYVGDEGGERCRRDECRLERGDGWRRWSVCGRAMRSSGTGLSS